MCVAELNRSTGPCGHTYFRLNRSCSTETSLANCGRLSLSGWENRTETCAVCGGSALVDPVNYRILGNDDPTGANLSRTNSLSTMTTASLASARRDSRRGSLARSDSSTSSVALAPMNQLASEKNVNRNQRIDSYLAQLPEAVSRAGQQSTYYEQVGGGRSRAGSTSSGGNGDKSTMSKLTKKGRRMTRDLKFFF